MRENRQSNCITSLIYESTLVECTRIELVPRSPNDMLNWLLNTSLSTCVMLRVLPLHQHSTNMLSISFKCALLARRLSES
ncbi:hypothetical protein VPHF86_0311 [Vibrio phage F86]